MKAGTLEIELITNVARLQKEMADMKRSVAGAMGDIAESATRADKAMGSALGLCICIMHLILLSAQLLQHSKEQELS